MDTTDQAKQYLEFVKQASSDMTCDDALSQLKSVVSSLELVDDKEKLTSELSKVCYFMSVCVVKKELSMLDVMGDIIKN